MGGVLSGNRNDTYVPTPPKKKSTFFSMKAILKISCGAERSWQPGWSCLLPAALDEQEEATARKWRTGLCLDRPGLLAPPKRSSVWFRHAMSTGALLFEPESLYRGVLYAAALATLALTNGSRVSELLQVSATRFETIVVDELKQQQPTGRKIGLLVQKLLPKGYTQESERQVFLIGEMASRLLREIGQLLELVHG